MEAQRTIKPKRQKKKKPRTEVSSDSESEPEESTPIPETKPASNKTDSSSSSSSKKSIDSQAANEAFTKFYMQQATKEFAEDLDRVRAADDFKDDALPILIEALRQGTGVFSSEEVNRCVGGKGKA